MSARTELSRPVLSPRSPRDRVFSSLDSSDGISEVAGDQSSLDKTCRLGEHINLLRFCARDRCLFSEGERGNKESFVDALSKLNDKLQSDLKDTLNLVLSNALESQELRPYLPEGREYNLYFTLTKKDGFVLRIGSRGPKVKVANFQDFVRDKGSGRLLALSRKSQSYARCAGLGRDRNIRQIKEPSSIEKLADKQFKKSVKILKEQRKKLDLSRWQKWKEGLLVGTNSAGMVTNAVSLSGHPVCLAISGLASIAKGFNYLFYNLSSLHEEIRLRQSGGGKVNEIESGLIVNGICLSILFIINGFCMFLVGLGYEALKSFGKFIGGVLFAKIFGNLFASLIFVNETFRSIKTYLFRKELKAFLENNNLSQREKCLGYLNKVKEKIRLSKEEEKKITKEVSQKERKKNPSVSQEMIEQQVAIAKQREIRKKIERLQKLTSRKTVENVINKIDYLIIVLEVGERDIGEAVELVKEIDKSSYQNLITHLVYVSISILCFLGNLFLATTGPLGLAAFWVAISLIFLIWDYSKSNNYLTTMIYNNGFFGYGSRKKKVEILLAEKCPKVRSIELRLLPKSVGRKPGSARDSSSIVA